MPDDEETIKGPAFDVREVGGRRIYTAQRLSSGNWLLVETNNASRRTINNDEFCRGYERVPQDDRKTGTESRL
jgi:hypothetical protein